MSETASSASPALQSVPIGSLVESVTNWNPSAKPKHRQFTYIDIGAVDQETKRIVGAKPVACADAPSRARQLVASGDVLVSTVRPNLNAVALVPQELDGATASTGFCVLRPDKDKLNSNYLFHWVKTPSFVAAMTRLATGAGYPAVTDRVVLDSRIPLPPLAEQRRIAAILDQADALRTKRRQALTELNTLTQSIFLEMFGDPATNPKSWPTSTLGQLADQITDGEHQTPQRSQSGIKLLSARNVRDGYLDFTDVDFIGVEEYERLKRRCNPKPGDVLISCSGTIGRVATVSANEPLSLVRSVALVRPDRSVAHPSFLEHQLRTPALQLRMKQRANASSQANLFQGQIRALASLVPPISLQEEFAMRAGAVDANRRLQHSAQGEFDQVVAALQQRAFRGEL